MDESKADFWESFGKPSEERGLGSRAMGTGGNGGMGGMQGGSGMTGMAGGMAVGGERPLRSNEGGIIGGNISPGSSKPVAKEKKASEPAKVEEGDWEKW